MNAQIALFQALPAHAVRSVTADNGSKFALYYELADVLAVPTYFADHTQDELNEFVNEINHHPRKIVGWATPAEIFHELAWELTPPPPTT